MQLYPYAISFRKDSSEVLESLFFACGMLLIGKTFNGGAEGWNSLSSKLSSFIILFWLFCSLLCSALSHFWIVYLVNHDHFCCQFPLLVGIIRETPCLWLWYEIHYAALSFVLKKLLGPVFMIEIVCIFELSWWLHPCINQDYLPKLCNRKLWQIDVYASSCVWL